MSAPRLSACRLVALDSVDSTNLEAQRIARTAGPEADPTVIWALRQTAGRGRRGRSWASEPGNLLSSILVRPDVAVARAAELGFVAALAVTEAAEVMGARGLGLKWPNDVLLRRRKLAGILLEGADSGWLAVGMGVNVAHHPTGTEFPATSLAAEGVTATVEALLTALVERFTIWRQRWAVEGFEPVRQAWLARAVGLGAPIVARLETESHSGVFRGLDGQGALLLETATGTRTITAADVFFPN